MQFRLDLKSSRPVVEFLEARSLLSGFKPLSRSALSSAMIGQVHPTIATDPAGIAAIMSALEGGMGREWVSLIRAGVKNPLAVIAGFSDREVHVLLDLWPDGRDAQRAARVRRPAVRSTTRHRRGSLGVQGKRPGAGRHHARAFPRPGSVVLRLRLQPRRGSESRRDLCQPPGNHPRRTCDAHRRPLRFLGHGNHHRPDDPLNPGDPLVEHRDPGPGRPRLPQDRSAPIQGLAASEVPLHFLDTNAARQHYLDHDHFFPEVLESSR